MSLLRSPNKVCVLSKCTPLKETPFPLLFQSSEVSLVTVLSSATVQESKLGAE